MKTYALATLGCKVNQYEGGRIEAQLAGLANVAFGQAADLYIINTCSVTAEAEAKARQLVNRGRRAAPNALIVLTGCWPAAQTEKFRALGVDLFFDNAAKADLVKNLPLNGTANPGKKPARPTSRTRAFVKVQDGCDQFCSYCSIPFYRPALSSRPIGEVVAEIAGLVKGGTPEVVLTGIHLGKYGVDQRDRPNLADLIEATLEGTSLPRLRLSSIEPLEVTDALINLMAADDRIARHLHIPLQSGSDKILSAMNRNYSAAEFLTVTKKIRKRLPDIGLTSDVIVGFPGETDADFQATLEVIDEAAFSRLHIFKYSARPGTPAAALPGQISPAAKRTRAAEVKALGARLAADFAASFIGRQVSVLIERERGGRRLGLTSQYVHVEFDERALDQSDNPAACMGIRAESDILKVGRIDG